MKLSEGVLVKITKLIETRPKLRITRCFLLGLTILCIQVAHAKTTDSNLPKKDVPSFIVEGRLPTVSEFFTPASPNTLSASNNGVFTLSNPTYTFTAVTDSPAQSINYVQLSYCGSSTATKCSSCGAPITTITTGDVAITTTGNKYTVRPSAILAYLQANGFAPSSSSSTNPYYISLYVQTGQLGCDSNQQAYCSTKLDGGTKGSPLCIVATYTSPGVSGLALAQADKGAAFPVPVNVTTYQYLFVGGAASPSVNGVQLQPGGTFSDSFTAVNSLSGYPSGSPAPTNVGGIGFTTIGGTQYVYITASITSLGIGSGYVYKCTISPGANISGTTAPMINFTCNPSVYPFTATGGQTQLAFATSALSTLPTTFTQNLYYTGQTSIWQSALQPDGSLGTPMTNTGQFNGGTVGISTYTSPSFVQMAYVSIGNPGALVPTGPVSYCPLGSDGQLALSCTTVTGGGHYNASTVAKLGNNYTLYVGSWEFVDTGIPSVTQCSINTSTGVPSGCAITANPKGGTLSSLSISNSALSTSTSSSAIQQYAYVSDSSDIYVDVCPINLDGGNAVIGACVPTSSIFNPPAPPAGSTTFFYQVN